MKRFPVAVSALFVVCLVTLSASASPQGKPEQKPAKPAVNVTGKWTMTLEMSMGTATPALEFIQDGAAISGTYTGRYGTVQLKGTLKERIIQFSFTMGAEGQEVTMSFSGEVASDSQSIVKGTGDMGELGEATWSAKRDKAGS
jgi:hypothetical protein